MARIRDPPHKSTKDALPSKRRREPDDTTSVELEPAAPVKKPKTTVRNTLRSRDAHETGVESEKPVPVKTTTVRRAKRPREVDDATSIESGVPAPGKTTKPQSKANGTVIIELEAPAPAKKAKSQHEANNTAACDTEPQLGARRSSRAQTKTPKATTTKRRRRSKEEITAHKAEAEAEKRRVKQLAEENRQAIMRMDATEDIDRAETAAQAIRTFADLNRDSSGEEFVGYSEILGEDSDVDDESDGPEDAAKLKKANRALEERLKALEAKIAGGKKSGRGGKKVAKKVTFASGLRPDWNSEDHAVHAVMKRKRTHVQISAGGLEDSDTEAVNPFPTGSSKSLTVAEDKKGGAQRDLSRRNELVSMLLTDEEEYVPHPAAKKVTARKVTAKKPTEKKIPVKVKVENLDCQANETVAIAKTTRRRLNGNNVRVSDLPEFAQGKWRETFLPTLYDKFFASDQPFDGFCRGSDQFVALLQTIIEEVYPNMHYDVTSTDSIHFLAYNRINEKRSSIGSSAINLVKQYITTFNTESAGKDWLRWSLRMDGPLFFKVPSPLHSPVDNKDPQYQFPEGRLLSQFVIGLARPLVSLRSGSASENGFPKGLVALIMAALERAVRYLLKPSIKAREFSKEFWGSKIDTYYSGFQGKNGVSDARWKELLDACGSGDLSNSDEDLLEAELSILDNNRGLVFDFCSPAKSR